MAGKKDETKCVNPWIGLLIITVVCFLMASAIFFEETTLKKKDKGKHGKPSYRTPAIPAAFPVDANISIQGDGNRIVF